ncbi:hypothetical protein E2C01_066131 [Portunus trituberculatus]|uniref:Uncharacterized protein n=1 Tax=Portunus trituberculatus TaxID=210409 RepID=A0A5B7HGB1_PORTR|nr:hypothetical protein [Portunus trituberculatus]
MASSNLMTSSEVLKQRPPCFSSAYDGHKTVNMAAAQHQELHLRNIFRNKDVLNELNDAELIKRYCLDKVCHKSCEGCLVQQHQKKEPTHPQDKGHHYTDITCHGENVTVQQ